VRLIFVSVFFQTILKISNNLAKAIAVNKFKKNILRDL